MTKDEIRVAPCNGKAMPLTCPAVHRGRGEVADGRIRRVEDSPAGGIQPNAEVGLVEVVGELLIEAADRFQRPPADRAVASRNPGDPPAAVRRLRWTFLIESLEARERGGTAGELDDVDLCSATRVFLKETVQ